MKDILTSSTADSVPQALLSTPMLIGLSVGFVMLGLMLMIAFLVYQRPLRQFYNNKITFDQLPPRFKNKHGVVLEAVKRNGLALQFAPDFQADRDLVMAAVKRNGLALQFAPDFKADRDLVMAAVKNHGQSVLLHASSALRAELLRDYCERGIDTCKGYEVDSVAQEKIKAEVAALVKSNPLNLRDVAPEWKNHKDIVKEAVKLDGMALKFAGEDMKNDLNVVLVAVGEDGRALQFASDGMQKNEEVVMAAAGQKAGGFEGDASNQNEPKKPRSKSTDLSGGEEKDGSPASSTVKRKR